LKRGGGQELTFSGHFDRVCHGRMIRKRIKKGPTGQITKRLSQLEEVKRALPPIKHTRRVTQVNS